MLKLCELLSHLLRLLLKGRNLGRHHVYSRIARGKFGPHDQELILKGLRTLSGHLRLAFKFLFKLLDLEVLQAELLLMSRDLSGLILELARAISQLLLSLFKQVGQLSKLVLTLSLELLDLLLKLLDAVVSLELQAVLLLL